MMRSVILRALRPTYHSSRTEINERKEYQPHTHPADVQYDLFILAAGSNFSATDSLNPQIYPLIVSLEMAASEYLERLAICSSQEQHESHDSVCYSPCSILPEPSNLMDAVPKWEHKTSR